mmetsp:Transcript_46617/g.101313  ORF Transcript_46617/g.101313 Transcript_46617/m.101313 type:complete len:272 (-) Transcript_46617:1919-2734(-)
MKSMWKFASSSFSNSLGFGEKPAGTCAFRSLSTAASTSAASFSGEAPAAARRRASSSLLSVSIDTSSVGVKARGLHAADDSSIAPMNAASLHVAGVGTPSMKARRFAAEMINCMCSGSFASKWIVLGSRFGGDQKGTPCDVVAVGGKLCSSCSIRLRKYESNLRRAQPTHSSNVDDLSAMRTSSQPPAMPQQTRGSPRSLSRIAEVLSPARSSAMTHSLPLAKNSSTSRGVVSKLPTNSEWARTRHWSMLCGKLWTAHCGASFSGGSCDAP